MSTRISRARMRVISLAATALLGAASLTGCSQMVDAFNAFQGTAPTGVVPTPVVTSQPQTSTTMDFNSQFTYDGSVALTSDIADGLQVRLDVWAVDSRRTQEWTTDQPKTFGFAVNVYDNRVDEKAVLTEKRRVFISNISVTSQTAQGSGQVQSPFTFSADPRTLVPTDTIRSDKGLLLNSFQGGLLVPETTIHQLPNDTFGITLEFSMNVWVEGAPNSDTSFTQQAIYQYVPIAIYPAQAATSQQGADMSGTQQGGTTSNGTQQGFSNQNGSQQNGTQQNGTRQNGTQQGGSGWNQGSSQGFSGQG